MFQLAAAQAPASKELTNTVFTLKTYRYGIGAIPRTNDVHTANYIRNGRVFGEVVARYYHARKLDTVLASANGETTVLQNGTQVSPWRQPCSLYP